MSCVPVRVDAPPASDFCESLSAVATMRRRDAEIERLRNEIERAELEGAHRGFDIAMRGDHGARNARAVRPHPFEQIESITVGQPHVRQAQIERVGLEQFLRGRHVARRLRRHLHARQRQRDELDEVGFVIDYQD